MVEDIAVLTGGKVISEDHGIKLLALTTDDLQSGLTAFSFPKY
jgi:hypothetical protein